MINRIIRFSVYNRWFVLCLTALVAALGAASFRRLPIDAVPDISNNQVQINTSVEGLIPEEIERTITFPIETALGGLAGVKDMRSLTRFGLSQVTVIFEDDVEVYRARQLVAERLAMVGSELPEGVRPRLGPVATGLGEIYHYALDFEKPATGEARIQQLMELRAIQEFYLKPRLLTVKGVAEVNTIGGHERQFHVQPDPNLLTRHRLDFNDLVEALKRTNQNSGGGYIPESTEQFLVQSRGLFKDMNDIRSVLLKPEERLAPLTIGNVAQVKLATELRTGAASVHGRETVIGTVLMLLGQNSRTVSTRVADQIAEAAKGLPPGVKIEPLYNRSELVNATVGTVLHNLITGAVLVIIVLMALLGNLRAALITAFVIPLCLLVTFILMNAFGLSGNLMSLGALDFGIIVDGAVIVLDHCIRLIHERSTVAGRPLSSAELRETIYEAAVEIRSAAGFGELIVVTVFLPLFGLTGVEGKMFMPMAATFCFAVFAALIFSFTAVPAMASVLLTGKVADKEPAVMRYLNRAYLPLLRAALARRKAVIVGAVVSVLVGVTLFARLGGEFLPNLDEGSILLQVIRPVNVTLSQAVRMQAKTEKLIEDNFPEVLVVFSKTGTAEIATDPMGINLTDTYVLLKPREQWPAIGGHPRTKAELGLAITGRLGVELVGQRYVLSQPIQMRFNELLEGTRADVSLKLYGEDLKTLSDLTEKIAGSIRQVRGAGDVELEQRGLSPLLQVTPNTATLKKYVVSPRKVHEAIEIAIGGREVGYLYDGVRRFPIVVRLNENLRSDLQAVKQLPVGIGFNAVIPLAEAATLKFADAYSVVNREQGKRRAAVLINPRGRDTESFVEEAQSKIASEVRLPPGYFIDWGGNFKNLREAKARLMVLAPLALVLVLGMIYFAFRNIAQTAMVFSGVPLALVGGVLGLQLNGLPFSISAGVGFIALSGIAVLNGVVLLNYVNELRAAGMRGTALVERAASVRLRPVVMTAIVAIFGFLPMMVSHGAGAEVQRPLAAVVVGGVISSTLLTLIVLPALYLSLEKYVGTASAPVRSH